MLSELRKAVWRWTGTKRVALASFPRSGNTWVRFMLEQATGEKSGSVYRDRILPRGRAGVVIKTHRLDSDQYTRAVHIVRNPFDAIESYYDWKKDIGGEAKVEWTDHCQQAAREWRDHTAHWLGAGCPTYRMRYEDIHADPSGQLQRLLNWLGYRVPEAQVSAIARASSLAEMKAINPELGPKFFRRGQVGQGLSRFSEAQKLFVLDLLAGLLSQCGYNDTLSSL